MGSLPVSRAGVGSAVNDTTRQTGGAIGVAVMGTVFAGWYHTSIGRLLFLPPAVRATARESIGTSLDAASRLQGQARAQLLHVAHAAFLSSMRVTYSVAVAMVACAVIVAWRFLPARAAAPMHVAPYDRAPLAPEPDMLEGLELGVENIVE